MAVALVVLAIGSIVAGYVGVSGRFERFLEPSLAVPAAESAARRRNRATLMVLSSAIAIAGIGLAAFFFLKNRPAAARMADRFSGVYRVLVNKYYVDEIYDTTIVQPIRIVSEDGLWKRVDVRGHRRRGERRRRNGGRPQRCPAAAADRLGPGVCRLALLRRGLDTGVLPVAVALTTKSRRHEISPQCSS